MIEVILAVLGLSALTRGSLLAFRSAPKASSWLAAGAGLTMALAARFASSLWVAVALYSLAGTGICAAAVVLLREALLRRERRERLADADDAEIRDLLEETQHPAGEGEIADRDAT